MTTHAKYSRTFQIFFARYFGPGEPFSMGGRDQKEVGPKKVQEMDFCQSCFHISGPQSARQYGTVRQGNLSFGRFLLTLSGIKRSQVMRLENCSLLTS